MFEDAVPIGIRCKNEGEDTGKGAKVDLNPSGARRLMEGEALLVLAEDDDTYSPMDEPANVNHVMPDFEPPKGEVERILICGFRRDLKQMLKVIDEQVVEGSELHWLHPLTSEEALSRLFDADESPDELLRQLKLIPIEGDTKSRKDLEKLPLEEFHSIMVLGDSTADDVESSDSESMARRTQAPASGCPRVWAEAGGGGRTRRCGGQSLSDWVGGTTWRGRPCHFCARPAMSCAVGSLRPITRSRKTHLVKCPCDAKRCRRASSSSAISFASATRSLAWSRRSARRPGGRGVYPVGSTYAQGQSACFACVPISF